MARPQDWCRGGPGTGVVRVKGDCGCGFWWQEWEAWGRRLLQIAWFLGLVTWVVAPQLPGKAVLCRWRSIISVSEGPRNLPLFLIPQSWCLCHSHRSSRAPPLAGRSGGQRLGWRTWGGRDARSVERGQWWCLVEPVLPSGVGSRQDRSSKLHSTAKKKKKKITNPKVLVVGCRHVGTWYDMNHPSSAWGYGHKKGN